MSKSKVIYITSMVVIVIMIMSSIDSPNSDDKYKATFKESLNEDQKKNKVKIDPEAKFIESADLHSKLIQTFRESLINTDYEMAIYTFEDDIIKHLYSTEEEIREDTIKEGFRSGELHGSEHEELHPRMNEAISKLTKNKTLTNIEIREVSENSTKYKLMFVYKTEQVIAEIEIDPDSHLIKTPIEEIIKQIEN